MNRSFSSRFRQVPAHHQDTCVYVPYPHEGAPTRHSSPAAETESSESCSSYFRRLRRQLPYSKSIDAALQTASFKRQYRKRSGARDSPRPRNSLRRSVPDTALTLNGPILSPSALALQREREGIFVAVFWLQEAVASFREYISWEGGRAAPILRVPDLYGQCLPDLIVASGRVAQNHRDNSAQ